MHTATKRWIPQSRAENPEGGFYLQTSPAAPPERKVTADTQLLRNFARVANLLALARRRNLCEWTKVFRAGATYNALQELNAAGAISMGTYKILDAWIFWGEKESKAKLGRGWWKPKVSRGSRRSLAHAQAQKVQKVQVKTSSTMKTRARRGGSKSPSKAAPDVAVVRRSKSPLASEKHRRRFKFKKRARHSLASAAAVASAIARVRPSRAR